MISKIPACLSSHDGYFWRSMFTAHVLPGGEKAAAVTSCQVQIPSALTKGHLIEMKVTEKVSDDLGWNSKRFSSVYTTLFPHWVSWQSLNCFLKNPCSCTFWRTPESPTLCCFDIWVSLYFLQAVLTIQSVYGKVYWNRLRAPLLAYCLFHLFSLFLCSWENPIIVEIIMISEQ